FYNTMMQADDPALIVECLNGYRLKEPMPCNLAEVTIPIGVPEILRAGSTITVVTYGAMCQIICAAATQLAALGIECEVIDVQTLLPFDRHHRIAQSLAKTHRIVFADEDVPGGTTAYMLQQV
ncbi:MAG: transketolase, partial [Candidatus Cardinium sp.]|nr:transketolase [Candidatus Cardinium sp.]